MPLFEIELGALAPGLDIALANQSEERIRLGDFSGRNVVVYFYPMDDTPGCTVEGKEFRQLRDQFTAIDCAIVAVSTDSVESHRKFAEKHALHFPLLADTKGELASAFGVLDRARASRATFVLSRDSKIRRVFRDVTPRGHAQEVLNFVRNLVESRRMIGG
ncbi:MAG TPA: peroxiredoxin [Candidatus Binataceae bacterium]